MTLTELLVVMVIMPLIVGAIASAFILILSQDAPVTKAIAASADAQVFSSHFTEDVQSASQFTTDTSSQPPGVPDQCGSVGTQLLGLEWDGYAPPGGTTTYQTVLSYDLVTSGSSASLVRSYCASGYSTTPTSTSTLASDVPTNLGPPTISGSVTGESAGWVPVQGVTGITFNITEPSSGYNYSLTANPSSGQQGVGGAVGTTPATNCGFATPTTGTYAANLCFVDFSGLNFAGTQGSSCQNESLGITGTPFTISFCFRWEALVGGGSSLAAASIPTYADPPISEAFLGTNGFYVGIPGQPAIYQQVEGSKSEVWISNIKVTDSAGNSAKGWQLVTGDAESTDSDESIMWSTCRDLTTPSNLNPFGVSTGQGCTSSDPTFSLLDNTPTSPFGNACADASVTSPGSTNPASYAAGVYLTGIGTTSVECGATVSSDKTGTVMLEASTPSNLSVYMDGTGLEGFFVGVLLP